MLFTDMRMDVRKANWIGHIVHRNCLLRHVINGNIEVTGRLGGRHKQLLDDVKEKRRHWKLKEEALDLTLLRNRRGRIKIKKERSRLSQLTVFYCVMGDLFTTRVCLKNRLRVIQIAKY
jgi:hypothetical protein